jgi:long-chain fatty acid transport protein
MSRSVVALGVLVLLSGSSLWAQPIQNVVLQNSFSPVGAGARGLGMGGAFLAVADDGTAASFNPAGLAQLRKTEIAVVGFGDQLTSDLNFIRRGSPQTIENKNRHGNLDFAGLSIPFEVADHTLTVNLSFERQVDLFGKGNATTTDTINLSQLVPGLPGTADFIATISPNQTGAFKTLSLAAGYQVTRRLSLGLSANYWFADWLVKGTNDVRLRQTGTTLEVPLTNTSFAQKESMRGLNFTGGLLLRYPFLSIGGVVRLPFAGDYTLGESDRTTPFSHGLPLPAISNAIRSSTTLHWPLTAGVGISLHPLRGFTLAGDFAGSHWSRTFIEDVPAGALLTAVKTGPSGQREDSFNNLNFFDLLPQSQTTTVNTTQLRGGVEYLIVAKKVIFPLRAGAFRDRSPVTDVGQDQGREIKGLTAGIGVNFTHVVFDVAVERHKSSGEVGLRLKAGEPIKTNLPTENVTEYRAVASLIYRFGENDPLKRAIHYLLVGGEKESN